MKKLSLLLVLAMLFSAFCMAFVGCDKEEEDKKPDPKPSTQTEKLSMVCIGDSITYGQEVIKTNEDGTFDYQQMKKPYPALIKDNLRYDVTNLAQGGATLCTGVHKVTGELRPTMHDQVTKIEEEGLAPDIISIMGGVNDWGLVELGDPGQANRDSKTLYGGIRVLLSDLKQAYPDAFIFFMTPVKISSYDSTGRSYTLEKVCEVIKEVCAELEVPVYDTYTDIEFDPKDKELLPDGVHQTQEFVKTELAPKIIQWIKDNYKAK